MLINPGTPTKLAFVSITALGNADKANAGAGFNVIVESLDVSGNRSNLTLETDITISLEKGTGTLTGTLTRKLSAPSPRPDAPHTNNRVTFDNLTYSKRESGVQIRASASGLTSVVSSLFDVFFATYYPVLNRGTGKFVGYAFANPSDNDITLTLEAYNASGSLASGITNPVTVSIPKNQQVAKSAAEFFGAGIPSGGWVVAKSLDDYRGFFLEGALNSSGSSIETIDGTDARDKVSLDVVFPNVVQNSSKETTLTLINPTVNSVSGTLEFFDSTGLRASNNFSLGPGERLEDKVNSTKFFAGLSNVDGYVRAKTTLGTASLVGYEIFGAASGDFVALRAQDISAEAGDKLNFAHVVEGSGYDTFVTIINPNAIEITLELKMVQDSGSSPSPHTTKLAANGMLRKLLRELFPDLRSGVLNVGYLEAKVTQPTDGSKPILGSIYFAHRTNGASAALPGQKSASAKLVLSHVAMQDLSVSNDAWLTGVALLNPDANKEARITIKVFKSNGELAGVRENFQLDAKKRSSRLLAEFVLEVKNQAGGYVVIESKDKDGNDLPIYCFELFGDWKAKKLASVPAQ